MLLSSCFATGSHTLTGTIKVTGNEPHTELIIVTENGKKYQVTGDKASYLRKEKQNNIVKLKGKIIKEPEAIMSGSFEVIEIE